MRWLRGCRHGRWMCRLPSTHRASPTRCGRLRRWGDSLRSGLVVRALGVQGVSNPQNIANTLWAFATLVQQPEDVLVVGLTARALEVQGAFKPQSIANTLSAFVTLGRQPEDALVAWLAARALEV